MKMKIKKILSLSLVIAMLFSFNTVGFAATNWLLEFNDYDAETDLSQWTIGRNDTTDLRLENDVLKFSAKAANDAWMYTSALNTTGVYGIEFNFDINLFSTNGYARIYYNNSKPTSRGGTNLVTWSGTSGIKLLGTGNYDTSANTSGGNWYSCSIKIVYGTSNHTVYFTIKDTNGNTIYNKNATVSAGNLSQSNDARIQFDTSMTLGAGYYLDNTSIKEITADDMPVSYATILNENFDSATASETAITGGTAAEVSKKLTGFGYNDKMYFYNGRGSKLSLATISGTDKVLEIDVSSCADSWLGIMYPAENMNQKIYRQEISFTYTDAVEGLRILNGGFGNGSDVAYLNFADDSVGIGKIGNLVLEEGYDFVSGHTYTVTTYYTKDDNNYTKVKVEVTDGSSSAVVGGTIPLVNNDIKIYPQVRFVLGETRSQNDKIVIISSKIYSASSAKDAKYTCEYSNITLNKTEVVAGEIKASVDVDSNITAQNTVSGAKLIICSYASDGTLDGLKIQDISKVSGTYEASLNLTANAKKVKAMLWDMDCGKVTPIFANVTIGE